MTFFMELKQKTNKQTNKNPKIPPGTPISKIILIRKNTTSSITLVNIKLNCKLAMLKQHYTDIKTDLQNNGTFDRGFIIKPIKLQTIFDKMLKTCKQHYLK